MNLRNLKLGSVFLLAFVSLATAWAEDFTLTILHTNDLHAHCEPVMVRGKSVGGYARQASAIIQTREESINPILLNGGDTFQGTLYFNVYEGLSDLAFMNLIGYQAMAVGNHEFDKGPGPLANFAKLARFPLLAANLDLSQEPSLKDLIHPHVVLEVAGEKVGIVGAVTPDMLQITMAGPTVKMKDYVSSIQKSVDELTKNGVNKVILLTHSGLETDVEMAKKLRGVDIVVGGHSHSLLGHVEIPDFSGSRGEYPMLETDAAGQRVLIVQAWEWGKVLGKIELKFDELGVIKSWTGTPILIDDTWPENPYVASMMEAFKKPIEAAQKKVIGQLETDLSQRFSVENGEPLMGNVIADAVQAVTGPLGSVAAFWNQGGVRSAMEKGEVTYGKLVEVCPFGNSLMLLDLKGSELLGALEHGLSGGGMLLPSKGFSYTFDLNAPAGKQILGASLKGEASDPQTTYKVTFSNFTAQGGDGHTILKEAKGARLDTGFLDLEALLQFFEKNSPVRMTTEGRIIVKR